METSLSDEFSLNFVKLQLIHTEQKKVFTTNIQFPHVQQPKRDDTHAQ